MAVVIETTAGDITVDLFIDERPQTCKNFLKLCKIKYYNFCLFHSIQHNFIAQTGDPTGTGKGGESIFGKTVGEESRYYEGEQLPKIRHYKAGLLSMVNCGDNMLGSQFFITLANDLQSLDGEHCVFGEVTEGEEILLKLNDAICDTEHRPYQDIRITHTVVLEDPFDDPPGLVIPDGSPEPTKENLANGRIAPDEDIDDTAGRSAAEIEELVKQREAQARATILEMVGDLPDADVAPPENVLFVCKLNPVTTDDDLEIIFSRFGKINSCEVIRDKTTGDSLQYAFIEFDEQKSCEDAYFKMANVLIDDRRIHVDFSQSVSKYRWLGKGRGVKIMGSSEDAHIKKESGQKQINQRGAPKDNSRSRGPERRDHREDREEDRNRDKERGRDRERDWERERPKERERERERDRERDRDRDRERDRERDKERERDRDRDRERERERERGRERERNREREHDRDRDRRDLRDSRDSRSHKDRNRDHTSRDSERNGQRYYESERDRRRKNDDDDGERNSKRDQKKDEKDGSDKEGRRAAQKEEGTKSERATVKGRSSPLEKLASSPTKQRVVKKEDQERNPENEDSMKKDRYTLGEIKEKFSNEHHKQSKPQNTPDSTSSRADSANSRISREKHSYSEEVAKSVSRGDKSSSQRDCESSFNSNHGTPRTGTDGNLVSNERQIQTTVLKGSTRDRSISTESADPKRNSVKSNSISSNDHHKQDKKEVPSEHSLNTAQKSHRILEIDDSSRSNKHEKHNHLGKKKTVQEDKIKTDSTEDCSNGDGHKRKSTAETKDRKSRKKKKRSGSTSSSDTSDSSSSSSESSDSSDSSSSDSDQKSKSRRKRKKKVVVSSKAKKKPRVVKIVKRKKKKHSDSDSSSDDSSSSDDHRSAKKKSKKKRKRKVEKVVLMKRKRKHSTTDETDTESESSVSSSSSDEKSSSRKRRRENEKKMKKKSKKQLCKKNKNGSTQKKKSNKLKNSGTSSSESSDSENNSAKLLVPD